MEWSELYTLGVPEMDATHQEFVAAVTAAATADDEALPARFDALIAHTEQHFARERQWMLAQGFAPDHCHMGEHDRVEKLLKAVRARITEAQDFALARRVLAEMAPWFDQHAATMDAPLAHYLKEAAKG